MNKEPNVIILCGGKGTRLYPLTANIPKPMVKIGEMPVIEHVINIFKFYGFKNIKLLIGYKGDVIRDYFENRYTDMNIQCIDTGVESNTAERIWQVRNMVSDTFFLAYSDVLADIDLCAMSKFHEKNGITGTMATYPLLTSYGIVKFDKNKIATEYLEKPVIKDYSINAGFFVFDSTLFDHWDFKEPDFSRGMIGKLCGNKLMGCYEHRGFWSGMDTVRENEILNKMWDDNEAKWSVWKK